MGGIKVHLRFKRFGQIYCSSAHARTHTHTQAGTRWTDNCTLLVYLHIQNQSTTPTYHIHTCKLWFSNCFLFTLLPHVSSSYKWRGNICKDKLWLTKIISYSWHVFALCCCFSICGVWFRYLIILHSFKKQTCKRFTNWIKVRRLSKAVQPWTRLKLLLCYKLRLGQGG